MLDTVPVSLRLDNGLKAELLIEAGEDSRTLSGLITKILRDHLAKGAEGKPASPD